MAGMEMLRNLFNSVVFIISKLPNRKVANLPCAKNDTVYVLYNVPRVDSFKLPTSVSD